MKEITKVKFASDKNIQTLIQIVFQNRQMPICTWKISDPNIFHSQNGTLVPNKRATVPCLPLHNRLEDPKTKWQVSAWYFYYSIKTLPGIELYCSLVELCTSMIYILLLFYIMFVFATETKTKHSLDLQKRLAFWQSYTMWTKNGSLKLASRWEW